MNVTLAQLIEQRFGLPSSAGAQMHAKFEYGTAALDTVAGLLGHRSMRRFKAQPVAQEILDIGPYVRAQGFALK